MKGDYSEMTGWAKFVFDLSLWISWVVRSALFYGAIYFWMDYVLPPNATDIPISQWTLSLIGGYVSAAWAFFGGIYWWMHFPSVTAQSSWERHPYETMWTLIWGVFSIAFLYWLFSGFFEKF
jgi:hypothetical protein